MCLYANNSCSADSRQKHLDAANRVSDKKSRTDDFEQEVWIEKALLTYYRIWGNIGRGERIRTSDHLTPSQVRYQAALRPELTVSNDTGVLPFSI